MARHAPVRHLVGLGCRAAAVRSTFFFHITKAVAGILHYIRHSTSNFRQMYKSTVEVIAEPYLPPVSSPSAPTTPTTPTFAELTLLWLVRFISYLTHPPAIFFSVCLLVVCLLLPQT